MNMRYLVCAFYPNLGVKVREMQYEKLTDMNECIGVLRMSETPYIAVDSKTGAFLEKEAYGLDGNKMAEMLVEVWYGGK